MINFLSAKAEKPSRSKQHLAIVKSSVFTATVNVMAEAAGLALGVVSLGLEVCKGLITYVDAVRGQTNELESFANLANSISADLEAARSIAEWIDATATVNLSGLSSSSSSSSHTAVEQCIRACEHDLNAIQEFIVEHAAGCAITSPGFRDKCREGYKKLKYGFRGAKRAELEKRLSRVNGVLVTGLQTLNM